MQTFDRVFSLPKRRKIFAFSDYVRFCSAIERLPDGARILVDLSDLEFAHPDGMAPLVATIRSKYEAGFDIDVAMPTKEFLFQYFEKAGWIEGIQGGAPSRVPGNTFIPLSRYDSAADLTPILDRALEHFASMDVYGTGVLDSVEWALNEVAGNVLDHAGGVPGWLQLARRQREQQIEIVVVDCGRGIADSLRDRFPEIESDRDAVRRAAEKGVTRDPMVGQGNGLAGTLRIAIGSNGYANIYSGSGLLRYTPNFSVRDPSGTRAPRGAADNLTVENVARHQGTVVSLTLGTRDKIDLPKALWGHRTSSKWEIEYTELDGAPGATFTVKRETRSTGNRAAARPIRAKLHNILNALPDESVRVDFAGVDVAAASFLDEFLARLAKEIGVGVFLGRIRITNANVLIRSTLDAVLEQRLKD